MEYNRQEWWVSAQERVDHRPSLGNGQQGQLIYLIVGPRQSPEGALANEQVVTHALSQLAFEDHRTRGELQLPSVAAYQGLWTSEVWGIKVTALAMTASRRFIRINMSTNPCPGHLPYSTSPGLSSYWDRAGQGFL
jgi:hypothetical protein